jgi:hypothetical protein
MEAQVRKLFERYEQLFRKSLAGDADMDEVTSVYASAFIAASPAGVMVGKNDEQLKQVMEQGNAHYRAIGTKEMQYGMFASRRLTSIIALPTSLGRRPTLAKTNRTSR